MRIRENRSTADILEAAEGGTQAWFVEDVVAQHECHRVGTDVLRTDHKCVRQDAGLSLRAK